MLFLCITSLRPCSISQMDELSTPTIPVTPVRLSNRLTTCILEVLIFISSVCFPCQSCSSSVIPSLCYNITALAILCFDIFATNLTCLWAFSHPGSFLHFQMILLLLFYCSNIINCNEIFTHNNRRKLACERAQKMYSLQDIRYMLTSQTNCGGAQRSNR